MFCFTSPRCCYKHFSNNIYGRTLAVSCWLTLCDNGNRKTDCGSTPLHGHSLLVGGGHDDTGDGRRHLHGQHRWVIGALFVVATFMSLQIIIFGFTFVTCKVQKINRRTGTTVVNFLALVRRGFEERFSASCHWSTLTNCLCWEAALSTSPINFDQKTSVNECSCPSCFSSVHKRCHFKDFCNDWRRHNCILLHIIEDAQNKMKVNMVYSSSSVNTLMPN